LRWCENPQDENAATRFALIAAIASGSDLGSKFSEALRDIFPMSRAAVNPDRFQRFIQTPNPYWWLALNDLLQDPQGCFFVDDDQYTDIALHVLKYMYHRYVPLN